MVSNYLKHFRESHAALQRFLVVMGLWSMMAGVLFTLLALFLKATGRGEAVIGGILSVRLATAGIFSFPASLVVYLIGRKLSLFISAAVMTGATLLMIWIGARPEWGSALLFVAAAIWGTAWVTTRINKAPLLSDYSSQEQSDYIFPLAGFIRTGGMFLGAVVSGGVADLLIRFMDMPASVAYQWTIGGFVALFSLNIWLVYTLPESNATQPLSKARTFVNNVKDLFAQKKTWVQVAYSGMIGIGSGFMIPFFPLFLKIRLGATEAFIGFIQGVSRFGVSLANLLTPPLVRKFGKVGTTTLCQLASIPFIFGIALPMNQWIVGASFFIRDATMNMVHPVNQNLLMQIYEERQKVNIISVNTMCFPLGRALGVAAGGFLIERLAAMGYETVEIWGYVVNAFNYVAPYLLTALLYPVGVIIFYFGYRHLEEKFSEHLDEEETPSGAGYAPQAKPGGGGD